MTRATGYFWILLAASAYASFKGASTTDSAMFLCTAVLVSFIGDLIDAVKKGGKP